MDWIKKIVEKIKSIFKPEDEKQLLEEPKKIIDITEKKNAFDENLKVEIQKKEKKRVETLVCPGDGLGIQPDFKA